MPGIQLRTTRGRCQERYAFSELVNFSRLVDFCAQWGVLPGHATFLRLLAMVENGVLIGREKENFVKMMKNSKQQYSLSSSSNLVLILFSLIVAFTLGFLASPLSRRPPSVCSSSPSPVPSSSLTAAAEAKEEKRFTSNSAQFDEKATALVSTTPYGEFVSHLKTLPDDLLRFHYACRTVPQPSPAAARAAVVEEVFDGKSPFAGFPPSHIARLVKRQKIKGWGSDHPVFEKLIKEVRPRIVVELGTFLGASAIHMSKVMRKTLAEGEEFAIFCLDDFRGWPGFRKTFTDIGEEHGNVMLFNQFLQNVAYSNASGSIVPVPFSTNTGVYKLCELGVVADLIEVDAGHDFHSAWTDINLAWSLMRKDGKSVMFGHDYFNWADYHGVRRAVDLFAKLKGLRVEPDGQHWIYRPQQQQQDAAALGVTELKKKKKKKNVTLLAK